MDDETPGFGRPVDTWADVQAAEAQRHEVPFGDGAVITAADVNDQEERG